MSCEAEGECRKNLCDQSLETQNWWSNEFSLSYSPVNIIIVVKKVKTKNEIKTKVSGRRGGGSEGENDIFVFE